MTNDVTRFVTRLSIFLIPIFIILGFFEFRLWHIPNSYNTKRAFFESQLDSIEVLALGSSQALQGINPAFFDRKGFNLSNVSQSLYYDSQLSLKYIDRMKKLKCVIVTVTYFSLWYQLCDIKESWRDYYYLRFWGIRYPEMKWYDSRIYSLVMLYTPRKTLDYAGKLFRVNLAEGLNKNGWVRIDSGTTNPDISDELGKERVRFHDSMRFENRFQDNLRIVSDFVNECKKRDIEVVLVVPPVLPTYSRYTNPDVNRVNKNAVMELCRRYGCQYFDYFTDGRFTIGEFSDNDHLNYLGAEKFSKILNDDIVSKAGGDSAPTLAMLRKCNLEVKDRHQKQ